MQDLYTENDKTLQREITEDLNKWREILCSWIGRLNIVKMSIICKLNYRFNTIPIKIPAGFSVESEKLIFKLIWKCKGPRRGKTTLKKKSKAQGFALSDFKTYYKSTVIKKVLYWHKDRQTDQRNRTVSTNRSSHIRSIDFQQKMQGKKKMQGN